MLEPGKFRAAAVNEARATFVKIQERTLEDSKMPASRLTFALLLCCAAACAAGCGGGQGSSASPTFSATPEQRPELTPEAVRKAINGSWIADVPAADGKDKPENWGFGYNEKKEIEIVEQKVEGDRATVVVNMKTRSNPRERRQLSLEGRLRFHLELQTEFIFREWRVSDVENISFRYTRLQPSPSPGGSPQASPTGSAQPPPPGLPPAPPPPAN